MPAHAGRRLQRGSMDSMDGMDADTWAEESTPVRFAATPASGGHKTGTREFGARALLWRKHRGHRVRTHNRDVRIWFPCLGLEEYAPGPPSPAGTTDNSPPLQWWEPPFPQTPSPVGTADNSATELQNRCAGCVPRWRGWPRGSAWPGVDSSPALLRAARRRCWWGGEEGPPWRLGVRRWFPLIAFPTRDPNAGETPALPEARRLRYTIPVHFRWRTPREWDHLGRVVIWISSPFTIVQAGTSITSIPSIGSTTPPAR